MIALIACLLFAADGRIHGRVLAGEIGHATPRYTAPERRMIATLARVQLRGEVVLRDFQATWCGMCRAELSQLDATYRALSAGGRFDVIGVSVDEDPELVRQFVASRGLAWPQTALGSPIENEIALRYNVQSTPTTVLIDRDGTVATFNPSRDELKEKIEESSARE